MKLVRFNLLWIVLLLSWIFVWYSCFWWFISEVLQNNSFTIDDTFKDVPWKAQVTDIYKLALKNVKKSELKPLSDSIDDTKDVINTKYWCNLEQEDVINIMYHKWTLKGTILEQYAEEQSELVEQELTKVSTEEFNASCKKLLSCKDKTRKPENINVWLANAWICNDEISSIFQMAYDINSSQDSFDDVNYGFDTFKNWSSGDGDFDLLIDIQNIWKLMFEWFKPPVEVVYYKLPDIVTPPEVYSNENEWVIFGWDWYSDQVPYNEQNWLDSESSETNNSKSDKLICSEWYFFSSDKSQCCKISKWDEFECIQPWCNNPLVYKDWKCLTQDEIDQQNSIFEDEIKGDAKDFIDDTKKISNEWAKNYWSVLGWNSCVSASSYTPEQEKILNQAEVETGEIPYDTSEFCESWYESKWDECCPVWSKNKDECKNPSCTNWWEYDEEKWMCISQYDENWDWVLSETEQENQIENYWNILWESIDNIAQKPEFGDCNKECANTSYVSTWESEKFLERIWKPFEELWCEANCCAVKCKDLPLSQRILCTSQCLCTTVSSPVFDPTKYPWLDSVYKIQMCMVAPAPTSFTRWKTVYSIEEIINEFVIVLKDLVDWGNMIQTVKAKELLDSTMKKVKFSELFSFNIIFDFKPIFDVTSEVTEKQKAMESNNILKSISNPENKNKYLVLSNAWLEKAKLQDVSVFDLQDEANKLDDKIVFGTQNILNFQNAETLETYAILNDNAWEFIQFNLDFWTNAEYVFNELFKTAENIKIDIQNKK